MPVITYISCVFRSAYSVDDALNTHTHYVLRHYVQAFSILTNYQSNSSGL